MLSPPTSMNSSSSSIASFSSTSRSTPSSTDSAGVAGARDGVDTWSGAGSAPRSSFPLGPSGRRSSGTRAVGTIAVGRTAARSARSAAGSIRAPSTGTT